MTQQEKIERIARAIASGLGRGGSDPNSTDRDFASKFILAWAAMKELDAETAKNKDG